MAYHVSALKRTRQTSKRTLVNRRNTSRLRRQLRALRRALEAKNPGAVSRIFPQTLSVIDRAAQKGVIKKNTAARYKSRLSTRVHALQAAPAA